MLRILQNIAQAASLEPQAPGASPYNLLWAGAPARRGTAHSSLTQQIGGALTAPAGSMQKPALPGGIPAPQKNIPRSPPHSAQLGKRACSRSLVPLYPRRSPAAGRERGPAHGA